LRVARSEHEDVVASTHETHRKMTHVRLHAAVRIPAVRANLNDSHSGGWCIVTPFG
jgi:hypothetical protein